ncbi:MAG: RluA family pseudouridine synthase [Clostridia bacterium]|nr:RluA family pseudouridine synthase [Clostridia bacterium]
MSDSVKVKAGEADAGGRIDAYLAGALGISRSAVARAIQEGRVRVNGAIPEKKYAVRCGDEVEYTEKEPELSEAAAQNIPLDIVFEDSDIIVINKPKGMVVHPAAGNPDGTLVNALLYHCGESLSGVGGVLRPGIVHRIDKDTSGLLVCAKNDFAHTVLSESLQVHGIVREYHALALGGFRETKGRIDLPIGRHPQDRKKMAVITGGKDAITDYEVLESFQSESGKISYLKLNLKTGRTHQIRVHSSYLGHPLLGDEVYGGGGSRFEKRHKSLLSGQTLHARALTLTHPRTGEIMHFECELPDYFKRLLEILREQNNH